MGCIECGIHPEIFKKNNNEINNLCEILFSNSMALTEKLNIMGEFWVNRLILNEDDEISNSSITLWNKLINNTNKII